MSRISQNGNCQKRLAATIDERRARVAALKVRGSCRQIVAELARDGVTNPKGRPWSLAQVVRDVEALDERWREEGLRDISAHRSAELARLGQIEAEAWEAWRRSIGEQRLVYRERREGGTGGDRLSVRSEQSDGDPRFLAVVLGCIQERAALLGLDAPMKLSATNPDGSALAPPLPDRIGVVLVREPPALP